MRYNRAGTEVQEVVLLVLSDLLYFQSKAYSKVGQERFNVGPLSSGKELISSIR